MGCFWSSESREKCQQCDRRAVNNLFIISGVCESCIHYNNTRSQNLLRERPRFGEYHCVCGRRWDSRLSWASKWQICATCRTQVFPHFTRKLETSDRSKRTEKSQEHRQDLCEMCTRLGFYCGNLNN